MIGPNGAGKTTLFNTIAGLYTPTAGRVFLDNEDITGLKPPQLFAKGLLRTFQIAHEFSRLSVIENLMMVPGHQASENLINTWFRRQQVTREEYRISERAMAVIDFLNLGPVANEIAANAMGKDVTRRHLEIFIIGSAVIGIGGAMLTTLDGQFTPTSYQPLRYTFLI